MGDRLLRYLGTYVDSSVKVFPWGGLSPPTLSWSSGPSLAAPAASLGCEVVAGLPLPSALAGVAPFAWRPWGGCQGMVVGVALASAGQLSCQSQLTGTL